MKGKTALFICAHPDDHILISGTAFKLIDKGYTYYEVLLTDGGRGRVIGAKDTKEILKIRSQEYQAAMELLGGNEITGFDLPDGGVLESYGIEVIEGLIKVIREVKPTIVFVMNPEDEHTDHVGAYKLAVEAVKRAGWGGLESFGERHKTPIVLVCDTIEGLGGKQILVDVSDYSAKKDELWRCYGSQLNDRFYRLMDGVAQTRGFYAGADRAECFSLDRLFPLKGDALNTIGDLV